MADDIADGVYGCLMGGAIGDALGAPVEGWHVDDVRCTYGKIDRFLPQGAAAERAGGGEPGQNPRSSVAGACNRLLGARLFSAATGGLAIWAAVLVLSVLMSSAVFAVPIVVAALLVAVMTG